MKKTSFFKRKLWALLTIFVIIANMFSPWGPFISEVLAAIGENEPYFLMELEQPGAIDDEDNWSDNDWEWYYFEYNDGAVDTPEECTKHFVTVNLKVIGGANVNSYAIKFKFDNTVLMPYYKQKKRGKWTCIEAAEYSEIGTLASGLTTYHETPTFDPSDSTIYINCGGTYTNPTTSAPFNLATFHFLLPEGLDPSTITTDAIELQVVKNNGGGIMVDGLELGYFPGGAGTQGYYSVGEDYLKFSGFKEPEVEKTVTKLELKGTMTNEYYVKGEDLDFSGLTLTVTYDNGDTEDITDIAAELKTASPRISADSVIAKEDGKITLTTTDKNSTVAPVDVNYYTATALNVSDLTKMSYEVGDRVEYKGATVTVTYTHGTGSTANKTDTIENAMTTGTIKEKNNILTAETGKTNLTFQYKDSSLESNLLITVKDPIVKIEVTGLKDEYNEGEEIDLTGGKITATTKSGVTLPDKIDIVRKSKCNSRQKKSNN